MKDIASSTYVCILQKLDISPNLSGRYLVTKTQYLATIRDLPTKFKCSINNSASLRGHTLNILLPPTKASNRFTANNNFRS